MNKKTKKVVSILTVVLLLLIGVAVFIAITGKEEEKKQTEASQEEAVPQGTDQSTLETKEEEIPQKAEIKEKADATESEWLSAAVVIAISMQYPEFEIEEIYISMEDIKETYVVFNTGGKQVAIHSKELSEERKEAGTKDIYAEGLGFATFDEVSVSGIKTNDMDTIAIEELNDLIAQSLLVSVYER